MLTNSKSGLCCTLCLLALGAALSSGFSSKLPPAPEEGKPGLPQAHAPAATPQVRVVVGEGTKTHPILVSQSNIEAFNAHANTEKGLTLHYRLVEDIVLPPPSDESNWTPIGDHVFTPFTGSLDGGGHTLSGLVISNGEENYQGLFGALGKGAVVQNLGLLGGEVRGDRHVGPLAGFNEGTVHNCYATTETSGDRHIGGLVGWNEGTVRNSYATGAVQGSEKVGGLVGVNEGTVQSSYAEGNVYGSKTVGGLVGINEGTVANSVALNASVSTYATDVGRVAGLNAGTLRNNRARSKMEIRHGVDEDNMDGTAKTISNNSSGVDGQSATAGASAGQYNNAAFWKGLGFDFTGVWQWGPGKLPVLRKVSWAAVGPSSAPTPKPTPATKRVDNKNFPSDKIINKALRAYEKALRGLERDYDGWDYTDGQALVAINGYPLLVVFPTDVSAISLIRYNHHTGKMVSFSETAKIAANMGGYASMDINREGTAFRVFPNYSLGKIWYYTLNDRQEFLFLAEVSFEWPVSLDGPEWRDYSPSDVNKLISPKDKKRVEKYGTFSRKISTSYLIPSLEIPKLGKYKNLTKADILYSLEERR